MKKFFAEFKKFITRGNVVDMAVGVIVGSSFTAIVNGMSNFILKPLINWLLALIFGADSLKDLYTMLKPAYVLDEAGNATSQIDLANSIYIDWGSFINAVINFFLIALVLFTIVKIINKFREENKEFNEKLSKFRLTKAQKKELKAAGIKRRDKEAVKAYFAEKARREKEAADKAAAEAEAKAAAERAANPTTEDLLKAILAEIKK
jgi:large conductance mechanosensitive channel